MPPIIPSAVKQAELLRQDGNTYFKKDRFGAAIEAYTEAITLCPNVPVYWTNRALCHRKRNDWSKVEDDCKRAIELDSGSVKAHYMLGMALVRREKSLQGIRALKRALELGRGANPNSYMVEEIWQELAKAKYHEWEVASDLRMWELQSLREVCQTAVQERKDGGDLEAVLARVFDTAAHKDLQVEVPDYLCCKITLDILRDPVITPSGITYERSVILDHLHKVGKFDPVTRETLHESELVLNLALKEAVEAYLEEHGWAYGTD